MKRYILKRHIDRYAPGADVTNLYPVTELKKWLADGLVRVVDVEEPATEVSTEETPVALDDLTPNPVEPAATTRKRK